MTFKVIKTEDLSGWQGPVLPLSDTEGLEDGLYEEQVAALRGVCDAVRERARSVSLVGYAGTGKTLLTGRIVRALREGGSHVVVTAPTHKAAGQLSLRLDGGVSTLHSTLGLSEHVDPRNGRVSFRPKDRGVYENAAQDADVLVVDEASMVGRDLLGYVKGALKSRATVLWVGDDAQLPPVGERECPALTGAERTFTLETVRRHGGDILREATRVREARTGGGGLPVPRTGDGVRVYGPGGGWLERAVEAFREHGEDSVRILSWTNRVVRMACDQVHAELHGADAEAWIPGMRVVALEPVFASGGGALIGQREMILHTSAEARVVRAYRSDVDGVACWRVTLTTGDYLRFDVSVLAEEGTDDYERRAAELKRSALETPEERKWERKKAWRAFYGFVKGFAKIERVYAMTVHKAQGSTYRHVWVNLRDISRNRNRDEVFRCYYTAITRAAESLHILV